MVDSVSLHLPGGERGQVRAEGPPSLWLVPPGVWALEPAQPRVTGPDALCLALLRPCLRAAVPSACCRCLRLIPSDPPLWASLCPFPMPEPLPRRQVLLLQAPCISAAPPAPHTGRRLGLGEDRAAGQCPKRGRYGGQEHRPQPLSCPRGSAQAVRAQRTALWILQPVLCTGSGQRLALGWAPLRPVCLRGLPLSNAPRGSLEQPGAQSRPRSTRTSWLWAERKPEKLECPRPRMTTEHT